MQTIGTEESLLRESELVIAFADLTLFMRTARTLSDADLALWVQDFYERVALPIEAAGGRVVKFIGDATLVIFPRELADAAVTCLLDLKRSIDSWMQSCGRHCRLIVKVHAGSAVVGAFGAGGARRFDVIGSQVNQAARLESEGFAISVAAFRALSPEARRLFKKHTPPVTYIPLDQRHC